MTDKTSPKGSWIFADDGRIHCSNCERVPVNRIIVKGQVVFEIPNITKQMRFCPHCGDEKVLKEQGGTKR